MRYVVPALAKEKAHLDQSIETCLARMSKAYDLIGHVEQYIDEKNPKCRAKVTPGSAGRVAIAYVHSSTSRPTV